MYNDDPLASKNTVRALVLVLGTYIAVLLGCSIRSRLDSYRQCDLYYLPTSLCRCFGAPACRVFPRDHLITYNLLLSRLSECRDGDVNKVKGLTAWKTRGTPSWDREPESFVAFGASVKRCKSTGGALLAKPLLREQATMPADASIHKRSYVLVAGAVGALAVGWLARGGERGQTVAHPPQATRHSFQDLRSSSVERPSRTDSPDLEAWLTTTREGLIHQRATLARQKVSPSTVVFDASMIPGADAGRRRGLMYIGNAPLPARSTVALYRCLLVRDDAYAEMVRDGTVSTAFWNRYAIGMAWPPEPRLTLTLTLTITLTLTLTLTQVRTAHGVPSGLARFECGDALEWTLPARPTLPRPTTHDPDPDPDP